MEELYVRNTYNMIGESFSHTRVTVWNKVEEFLNRIECGSKVLDAGCGNCKNMAFRKDEVEFTGIDNSFTFVQMGRDIGFNVIEGEITDLPFEDKTFDYTICIAVIHHLSNSETIQQAINELLRVTKKRVLVSWWYDVSRSINATRNKSIVISENERLIPWSHKNRTYFRYYNFIKPIDITRIIPPSHEYQISEEMGNIFVEISITNSNV
jgi:ubiquinone/menaquinone biosynthesis C-methylase UbiE